MKWCLHLAQRKNLLPGNKRIQNLRLMRFSSALSQLGQIMRLENIFTIALFEKNGDGCGK